MSFNHGTIDEQGTPSSKKNKSEGYNLCSPFHPFEILVELPCSCEIHKKQKKVHASFMCFNNISKIAETTE
jgi:hypothetical protein